MNFANWIRTAIGCLTLLALLPPLASRANAAPASAPPDTLLRIAIEEIELDGPADYGLKQLLKLEGNAAVFTQEAPDLILSLSMDTLLPAEGYRLLTIDNRCELSGGDGPGLMYGLLHLRDRIASGQTLPDVETRPTAAFRAIKFNLPWSSYRNGQALALHRETVGDTAYWMEFLDMMADNRFNTLTLWSLHPFPYLVRTEKYPEATDLTDEQLAEWQTFWHRLFEMARERGIETYLVNWNIFVSPAFARAHGVAEYSLTGAHINKQGDTSELVKDYTREVVREVIDTYPALTGLGITLGEGMGGMTALEREQWILDAYVAGAKQAKRNIKFIHRLPLSANKDSGGSSSAAVERMTRRTLDTLSFFTGTLMTELKFNWSHAFSTPELVKAHGGTLTDAYWNPAPQNYRLAWMMRNEDFFALRWGQADFIRNHLKRNLHPYVAGYYVGSECYIPAVDYFTKLAGSPYRYAFERQWMFYQQWGRLLYDAETSDDHFIAAFEARFPGQGERLYRAQSEAGRVPLWIAAYWNGSWDFTLYSEGMLSMEDGKVGLMSLSALLDRDPLASAYQGIAEYLVSPDSSGVISPVSLADSITASCRRALAGVTGIDTGNNVYLRYEVADIVAWARLGLYFGDKLRAAVAYGRYLETHDQDDHANAVGHLSSATSHWAELVELTSPIYREMPLMHYTHDRDDAPFHWSLMQREVEDELLWLKRQ